MVHRYVLSADTGVGYLNAYGALLVGLILAVGSVYGDVICRKGGGVLIVIGGGICGHIACGECRALGHHAVKSHSRSLIGECLQVQMTISRVLDKSHARCITGYGAQSAPRGDILDYDILCGIVINGIDTDALALGKFCALGKRCLYPELFGSLGERHGLYSLKALLGHGYICK